MRTIKDQGSKSRFITNAVLIVTTMFLILTSLAANAEDKIVTQETLLDRIQIEDMIVRYYVDMSAGKSHDLAMYYTEDAVLDVNGIISNGRKEIEKLYESMGDDESDSSGTTHMLLNNAIINVNGKTATAWFIWSGVKNDDLKKAPYIYEQGREYDELVKIKNRWYIKKRYITSDSGMSEMWEKTYKPRSFR